MGRGLREVKELNMQVHKERVTSSEDRTRASGRSGLGVCKEAQENQCS